MNNSSIFRDPTTIEEEIYDLREYLDGLPQDLRSSGAFTAYEHHMIELNTELLQSIKNKRLDILKQATNIVSSHASMTEITTKELVEEIKEIYYILSSMELKTAKGQKPVEVKKPPIPLKDIVKEKYVVCLECGKKMRSLKAHLLKAHNILPREYYKRYGLDPKRFPLFCREYFERSRRSTKRGLRSRKVSA